MNTESSQIPCRSLLPGFGLLLTLASCGASHVGETWQCPLAQGSPCVSVETADPAIRPLSEPTELAPLVLETITTTGSGEIDPSHKHEGRHSPNSRTGNAQARSESCRSRCNPVGWLWRWLTGGERGSPTITDADDIVAGAPSPTEVPAHTDADSPGVAATAERPSVADTGSAEEPLPESLRDEPPRHPRIPAAADVRVPEKIGRVWIAPWVDASGVYREGAWVRVVLSPATWRRPH